MRILSRSPPVSENFQPGSRLPFLGKVLEQVAASRLRGLLGETDFLDPFQSGFGLGFVAENALVTLLDELH